MTTPARESRPGYPDTIAIEPVHHPLDAVVTVPGSKSITNRALLVAALADGPSRLAGVLEADDTAAMADCLRRLGVAIELRQPGDEATVHGLGGRWPAGPLQLDARQSGTTARFLPPALALGTGRYVLDGDTQLRARPFGPLFAALRQLGVHLQAAEGDVLPVTLDGGGHLFAETRTAEFLQHVLPFLQDTGAAHV